MKQITGDIYAIAEKYLIGKKLIQVDRCGRIKNYSAKKIIIVEFEAGYDDMDVTLILEDSTAVEIVACDYLTIEEE